MNRTLRSAAAVLAVAAVAVLTGCTAQNAGAPSGGSTARPASVQQFTCPTVTEVAALTATPFSTQKADASTCTYGTGTDVDDDSDSAVAAATVTVRHAAGGDRTAAAIRYAAVRRGDPTSDLTALAFDAFTTSTAGTCTAWFPAADGALSSVVARRDGVAGVESCDVAASVATLAGSGSATSTEPTVAVLAQRKLLGTATDGAAWPWRIGRDSGARIARSTGTGYLRPSSSGSFTAAASRIPGDSAAVVVVSGTAGADASRLEMLSAATAALSAAAARAPKAKLIVVGPVGGDGIASADLQALRVDLESAARIAGARYVDPADQGVTTLDGVADAVTAELRQAGLTAG